MPPRTARFSQPDTSWPSGVNAVDIVCIADDEILAAQSQWPDESDVLYHAHRMLRPENPAIRRSTTIYRAYVRELLERVATGADTRPGTAIEVCLGLSDASLRAPLSTLGFALYSRMWVAAGMPPVTGLGEHYVAAAGPDLDCAEAQARTVCGNPRRIVGDVDCTGIHHGIPTCCRFARGRGGITS